ncbi:MAG: family 20 glycosylhydrolase [Lentisphaerae bacterium]|nr:family 20 glycosylhydrolase [Lentisphaerota bacterium]
MKLSFIPQPKQVRIHAGRFVLPRRVTVGISDGVLWREALRLEPVFGKMNVGASPGAGRDTVSLCIVKGRRLPAPTLREVGAGRSALQAGRDAYRLEVDRSGVRIEGASAAGVFYGIQTLLQVARQSPAGRLPWLTIDDWPDFEDRGVYYDVARGRVPKLEQLFRLADTLARYKINQLQLYIEHTFVFRGHPKIGTGASPLTAEDILRLDAYCAERHIELVPSLASFGHMGPVLKHPEYHKLCEDWGIGKYLDPAAQKSPWVLHNKAWCLSPANPKIYPFLDSLFAEFLPLFSSKRFNICCDETWNLGYGQSYELCRKLGKGRVYLNHIVRLRELSAKYGKQVMFWGDIIRHHPELIPDIPGDALVLDWGYNFNQNFEAIRDFKKAGLEFYACPGVSSWVSLFPRLHEAAANIAGFAAAGKKAGAKGLLNTDWGDGGHYNFMEYSWHGYLFGAEQSWNAGADRKRFTERFCREFLRSDDRRLASAIDRLGDIAHLGVPGYYQSFWTHIFFAGAKRFKGKKVFPLDAMKTAYLAKNGRIESVATALNAGFGRASLEQLDGIRAVLAAHADRKGEDPLKILPYWVFAVDTLRHAARKLAVYGQGSVARPAERVALAREQTALMKRFRRLWLARNRPSEIRITLGYYRQAIRARLPVPSPKHV